jgi:hypothetical protein
VACHAESERLLVPLGRGDLTGFRKGRFDFADAGQRFFGQFVFPDAKHMPALSAKRFGDKLIPERVGCELLSPKWPVVDWQIGVLWASMPETTIHENNDALPAKGEIRFSKMFLSATPAGDGVRSKKFCKGKFRIFVAMPANAGHDLRAFGFGKDVRHC